MDFYFKPEETEIALLPKKERNDVLYAIYLLKKRSLQITYNAKTKETCLSTPNDASHLNSISGGDWFTNVTYTPPELSFLMLYLAKINIEVKPDGFYLLSRGADDGLTRIVSFKVGKNNISLEGDVYLHSTEWDLSNAWEEEFKTLNHYQDQMRLIHQLGSTISYKKKLPLSKVYTLDDCSGDKIHVLLSDLIEVLVDQSSLELNTTDIRNERKYIYALSRVSQLPSKMVLFNGSYLHDIYNRVLAYLNY